MSSLPQTAPLSRGEAALFYKMGAEGTALLLVQRLGRPAGAREIGYIMGIDEHTAAKYLLNLSERSLVARIGRKQGYVLAEAGRRFLVRLAQCLFLPQVEPDTGDTGDPGYSGAADFDEVSLNQDGGGAHNAQDLQYPPGTGDFLRYPQRADSAGISRNQRWTGACNAQNSRCPPAYGDYSAQNFQNPVNTITSFTDRHLNNYLRYIAEEEVVIKGENSKNPQNAANAREAGIWEELSSAGIGLNRRTQELVRRPHMTPEYVRGHRLRLEASGKGGLKYTGLLVTILESGQPAPELNDNGHLVDCECPDCERVRRYHSWSALASWEE